MPVQQLIRHFSGGRLISKFQRRRPEPLDTDNGHQAVGENTPNRRIGLKSFELTHESGAISARFYQLRMWFWKNTLAHPHTRNPSRSVPPQVPSGDGLVASRLSSTASSSGWTPLGRGSDGRFGLRRFRAKQTPTAFGTNRAFPHALPPSFGLRSVPSPVSSC